MGYTDWIKLVRVTFGSDDKAPAYNVGDLGLIPGSGRSSGEGNSNPPQYSCLENPMDGGTWWATVHGVTESDTTEWLNFGVGFGVNPTQIMWLWMKKSDFPNNTWRHIHLLCLHHFLKWCSGKKQNKTKLDVIHSCTQSSSSLHGAAKMVLSFNKSHDAWCISDF